MKNHLTPSKESRAPQLPKRVDQRQKPVQNYLPNRNKNLNPRLSLNPKQFAKDNVKKWAIGLISGGAIAGTGMAWWILS